MNDFYYERSNYSDKYSISQDILDCIKTMNVLHKITDPIGPYCKASSQNKCMQT